jgi:hypothetical protein
MYNHATMDPRNGECMPTAMASNPATVTELRVAVHYVQPSSYTMPTIQWTDESKVTVRVRHGKRKQWRQSERHEVNGADPNLHVAFFQNTPILDHPKQQPRGSKETGASSSMTCYESM